MAKSKPTPSNALASLMAEFQLNPFSLSKAINLSNSAILQILNSKGKITVPTALRLAKFFGQTAAYWLDLQRDVDLEEAGKNKELASILKGINKAVKPKAGDKPKVAAKPKAGAKPKAAAKQKAAAKPAAKKPVKKKAVKKA